ncbi:hypothetical protein HYPSUDRAFT_133620 [Hypholoma sublateritium FD-334 SS-4]|uniref:BTB domain-containing protein n=1 Tax=Hypholoma sublateritium (strain FD-334 SS-4) TaxID=945553 RepID=A0A0D2Q351_HYPSF|nr:hypothetical protein HYPSUDRAFT_133620 [Hypholoma sublateritium FD-334 SS-4]
MSWTTFHCENPDFKVRSIPDDTTFAVRRAALQGSEVFKDMFALCDPTAALDSGQDDLELHERSGDLETLLLLLHSPPAPPTKLPSADKFRSTAYDPVTVIPLPLLLALFFPLADKYMLADAITRELRAHLVANAPAHALEVYSFAARHGMEAEAARASQFVRPVASYRFAEITVLPDVVAYHKLVRLQDFRVKALRGLLLAEDIFPHGYGECPSHGGETSAWWDRQRKALVGRIETVTDVAGEMDALTDTLRDCKICHKACVAAVEMLAYKCKKLPKRLDQLPNVY